MSPTMQPIIMLVLMLAIFYFMLIRPENKRKKQAQQMRDGIKKGDTITTIGGIIGNVVLVEKDTLIIETSDDRVRMKITKWAVSSVGEQTSEYVDNKKKKKDEEKAEAEKPAELPNEAEKAESAEDSEKKD